MRSSRRPTRGSRRGLQAEGRQERRSGRRAVPQKKDNTLLIIGGAGGGLLLLIIVIAVVASSGPGDDPSGNEARPVDVEGLVRAGTAKCEEGRTCIFNARSGSGYSRSELEKGKRLIEEGMSMLDEASQKTNWERKFETRPYQEALIHARKTLLEMK